MSLDDIEFLDTEAGIMIRRLFDRELSKSAELKRLQKMLDMADSIRAGMLGTHKATQRGYKDWKKAIERRIRKLKGIKTKDATRFFRPGMKY